MQEYLSHLKDEDQAVFKKIEALRAEIIARDFKVKVVDYGAGEPEENRSEDMMRQGVNKEVSTKDLCKIGLKSEFAHLIYALVQKYRPSIILELGTCCGFSSIYMSKALDGEGVIHTIEGSPGTAEVARQNFKDAECKNVISHIGRFSDVLPELLESLESIEFAFIDGHHDKDATLAYFEQIKPYLSENALVLFDDISWSEGMKEAWKEIRSDRQIASFKDFHKVGLCFMSEEVSG